MAELPESHIFNLSFSALPVQGLAESGMLNLESEITLVDIPTCCRRGSAFIRR